jgi:hypothetical protein
MLYKEGFTMEENKNRKFMLIGGLVLTIIIIFLPTIYTRFYHDFTGAPVATNGRMDLSEVELEDGKTYMDGQWEFYWNRFIESEPEQLARPDFIIEVPGEWSSYQFEGTNLPANGYASYKLSLDKLSYKEEVTMYIPDFSGAYRIFIDGRLVAESGSISKDNQKIFTVPKSILHPILLSNSPTHEVVIEVATTRFSGIYMTPILGDYTQIIRENSLRSSIRFILFGIVLFSFVVLISMYLLSVRNKVNSFWMPVMILFIMIRIMITTEFYSFWQPILFFNLPYEATNELMYFVSFALKYLQIYLIQEQSGIVIHKREKVVFLSLYAVLYLIYLFIPQNIYNQLLSVIVPMLTFTIDIFLFVKVYRGRDKLQRFGIVAFLGSSLITTGLAIDSFYINGKIYMNMSLSMIVLFLVFLLTMGLVYTMRIGDLYDDFTKSTSRLELAKKQISMQREYYATLSQQMNEIGKIKHEFDHFVQSTIHFTEEGNVNKLKEYLSEYSAKAKADSFVELSDHAVVNSILRYYDLQAKENGILFENKCVIDSRITISDSDLCMILGNALDNAIYACKQLDSSKSRFVSIEAITMEDKWLIKVTNSYDGQLVIHDGRYLSSKSETIHGFGIRNIEQVIKSYGGIMQIEHNEKVFTLMAIVPINRNID